MTDLPREQIGAARPNRMPTTSVRAQLRIPRPIRVIGGIVSAILGVLGLGGIQDDLATWQEWLAWVARLDDDIWRWSFVFFRS